jgi:hypothetical protein
MYHGARPGIGVTTPDGGGHGIPTTGTITTDITIIGITGITIITVAAIGIVIAAGMAGIMARLGAGGQIFTTITTGQEIIAKPTPGRRH